MDYKIKDVLYIWIHNIIIAFTIGKKLCEDRRKKHMKRGRGRERE